MVSCFLDGYTLEEAIERKELYFVNLSILEQVSCPEGRYVSDIFIQTNFHIFMRFERDLIAFTGCAKKLFFNTDVMLKF